ncbi:PASTA domain-containing protein [Pseudoxanthomonas sangjuensis]|uniref:PASTA domain-containing protein n=1 Tax=Pseudoxanthomonas sangjuensis TaxID=1503750 RepID=UPI0013912455|nr:PASTA domain-containing protein [Pseudoxanthomonas sangjuensis]
MNAKIQRFRAGTTNRMAGFPPWRRPCRAVATLVVGFVMAWHAPGSAQEKSPASMPAGVSAILVVLPPAQPSQFMRQQMQTVSPQLQQNMAQQSQSVAVPDVAGMPGAIAARELMRSRLRPGRAGEEPSRLAKGLATRTDPAADAQVASGSGVRYWVASGRNVVPRVDGMTPTQASDELARSGFRLGNQTVGEEAATPGRILRQAPTEGSVQPLGTAVDVVVSRRLTAVVPALNGRLADAAVSELSALRLTPVRQGTEQGTLARGLVTRTDPEAGTRVPVPSQVAYWIASGSNAVPDVRQATVEQAGSLLDRNGFRLGALGFRDTSTNPGLILEQTPVAGSSLILGTAVDVVVARRPSIVVPPVVGKPVIDATGELAGVGLAPVRRGEENGTFGKGRVARTDPAAGTSVAFGSEVGYWAASGANAVPDVGGMTPQDAEDRLHEGGFRLGAVEYRDSETMVWRVLKQQPVAGSVQPLGTGIDVVVARSQPDTVPPATGVPPPIQESRLVEIPPLVGESEQSAIKTLSAIGLAPARRGGEAGLLAAGGVTRTDPPAGTLVKPGSEVGYWVRPWWQNPLLAVVAVALVGGILLLNHAVKYIRTLRLLRIEPRLDADDVSFGPDAPLPMGQSVQLHARVVEGEAHPQGPVPVIRMEVRHD